MNVQLCSLRPSPSTFTCTAALLGAALGSAACSRSGDEPSAEDYDDVALSVASTSAQDGGGEAANLADSLALAASGTAPGMQPSGSGVFTGTRGQLTYTYDVTCRDAGGTALPSCTGGAAETADVHVEWQGSIDLPRYKATVQRSADWRLGGLSGATVTLDGTGSFALQSEFTALYRPVTRTLDLDYAATYQAVQIDRTARKPIGGSIAYEVTAHRTRSGSLRDVDATIEVDAVLSFSPAGATLTLDRQRTYQVDLQTGAVTPTSTAGN
jgi:hypothetical protein